MDDKLSEYINSSYSLLQNYEKKGRYFHELTPFDNSPTVVHKQTNQLTYVLSGDGIVYLNGKPQNLMAKTVVVIDAGILHRFVATSEKLILFHIHVPDEGRDNDRFIVEGEDYERFE